ncbi:MAG: acetoacetate decarboxylase family protein, partial [Nocardioides sp.]|nr:acetoacetate decarboxylase family protein [Nocardioides sp.]
MGYPPAPWQMYGDLWLSLFRVADDPGRPPGVVGVAWVIYRDPSPLTYHELLVARPRSEVGQGWERGTVTISDIWVDSPASHDGGRELWAIPKDLCDFTMESSQAGPLRRTSWQAAQGSSAIA